MATSSGGREWIRLHPTVPVLTRVSSPLVTVLVIFLPVLCYILAFVCNDVSGCPAPSLRSPRKLFTAPLLSNKSGWQHGIDTLKREVGWPGWTGLLNVEGALGTLAWYALSLALWALLPAYEVEGTELRTGGRLKYRFNGVFPTTLDRDSMC